LKKYSLLALFLFFFSSIAFAGQVSGGLWFGIISGGGPVPLDSNRTVVIGDFFYQNNGTPVTVENCTITVYFSNQSLAFDTRNMAPSDSGLFVSTFEFAFADTYFAETVCTDENGTQTKDSAMVDLFSLQTTGIDLSEIQAELQCDIAGRAGELQGNTAADPNSTLFQSIILVLLTFVGLILIAIGYRNGSRTMLLAGSCLLMFSGLWLLVNGFPETLERTRSYTCFYNTNETTSIITLANVTALDSFTSLTSSQDRTIVNGFGLVILLVGLYLFVWSVVKMAKTGEGEAQAENQQELEY